LSGGTASYSMDFAPGAFALDQGESVGFQSQQGGEQVILRLIKLFFSFILLS